MTTDEPEDAPMQWYVELGGRADIYRVEDNDGGTFLLRPVRPERRVALQGMRTALQAAGADDPTIQDAANALDALASSLRKAGSAEPGFAWDHLLTVGLGIDGRPK